jgi:hypothetical protein
VRHELGGALIADYVASVEAQLTPRSGTAISTRRLMWCVRSDRYLQSIERAGAFGLPDAGVLQRSQWQKHVDAVSLHA